MDLNRLHGYTLDVLYSQLLLEEAQKKGQEYLKGALPTKLDAAVWYTAGYRMVNIAEIEVEGIFLQNIRIDIPGVPVVFSASPDLSFTYRSGFPVITRGEVKATAGAYTALQALGQYVYKQMQEIEEYLACSVLQDKRIEEQWKALCHGERDNSPVMENLIKFSGGKE